MSSPDRAPLNAAKLLRAFSTLLLLTAFFIFGMAAGRADITGVGTNFWFQGQSGASSWTGCKPFLDTVDFSTTTNPWNPTFLSELTPYKALRFMDWNGTNNSGQTTWAGRKQKTDPDQTANFYASNAPAGMAYEWMIDLCNRTSKDMWVCLPHKVDENYAFQLATLIKNTLNPNLKVYLEYSNEVWNGGFEQTNYCNQQGSAMGFDTELWSAGSKYYTYAATKLFHQFDLVFGTPSTRICKILAGQRTNDGGGLYHLTIRLDALNNPTTNPYGVHVDAISVAAYFADGLDGASPTFWTDVDTSITTISNSLAQIRTLADQRGLQFVGYEGGQSVYTNADIVNHDSRMYTKYINWLNAIKPKYNGLFMHYCHTGVFNSGGAWGAKEFTGQDPAQAHKYRALTDWINTNFGGVTQAATPNFSPAGGTFATAQTVTLSDTTPGATIYYTTDGSTPTTASTVYTAPISVTTTKTIKAIATASGYTQSVVGSATYTINSVTTTVPLQINAGGGASAPYIADSYFSGGTSFTNWTGVIDTSLVTNPAPQVVYQNERYGAMTYTIPGLSVGTTYVVRLHFCENYFTISNSRVFNVAINGGSVLSNFDIYAAAGAAHKAVVRQFNAGPASNGAITIDFTNVTNNALVNGIEILPQQVAAPTFSPAGGTYSTAQNVTLTSATTGATIRYTTNGTTPTSTTGTIYSGAITVSTTTTIKAIAYKSGMTDSTVASATYTISAPTTVTLTATDDRDTQSDNASGTNPQIASSMWNSIYVKFDLSSVTGTITNAKLRIYKNDASSSLSMTVFGVASDSWTQATAPGSLPGIGGSVGSATVPDAVGYVDIDITAAVQAQYSGDKVISLAVQTAIGGWTWFSSKEGANAPKLIVTRQ